MAPRAGGPWEQQDGVEMVVYRILIDFGLILTPVYISFLNSRSLKFRFLFGLVSRPFVYRFLNRNFDAWDFQIKAFKWKLLLNSIVHGNRFLRISEAMLVLVEQFFWFFKPW